MTDVGRMSTGELVGKVLADEHADVLRDAVCWLAQQRMEAEVSQQAGAGYGERSPGRTATGSGPGTPAWGRSSWPSQSCALAPTSRASWSRAAAPNRPWWRWSRRPTSTACRPARSTGWWRHSAWPACPRTPSRGCAVAWTSRSPHSGSDPWRAPTPTCGWTPRSRRSAPAAGSSTAPWWSPTASTSPASGRSSAWTWARPRPRRSGGSSSGAWSVAA
jgi:hypothetical protein